MSVKDKSNEAVIKSGQRQLGALENDLYLHNFVGNYEEIGGDFEWVDINIMDAIQKKILARQKREETKIYNILDVKGVEDLNKLYMESGGDNEFINSSVNDIISEATKNSLVDLSGRTSKAKISALNSAISESLEKMIDEEFGDKDNEMAEALKKGLGDTVAKRLANRMKNKDKPKNMQKYVNSLSKVIGPSYRGEILETESGIIMARLMDQLVGSHRGNVKLTATTTNSKGKQIKADNTLILDNKIEVGISDKNYKPDGQGNVEVTLHSSGSLENFYNLVERAKLLGRSGADMAAIQGLVSQFKKPNFKYHLINQAAFAGVTNIQDTDVAKNIISFVKKCLPLFIGAQFKIQGDDINVDFFNINGKLVPVSVIMEDCFNGGPLTGLRIGLYSNYEVPWYEMLRKKTENPVEDDQYYTEHAREVGSLYGNKVYKQINVGTIHLKVALANIK